MLDDNKRSSFGNATTTKKNKIFKPIKYSIDLYERDVKKHYNYNQYLEVITFYGNHKYQQDLI